ncbi:response regulator transcription factor [Pseudogracilibacillus sp. SE30717A]|uniref:response regulator transcription factor n=1 Tax=Pseudogracilibacillus sp. SE30717A TaxID=3098293 RepID=UPI00300E2870
MDGKEKITIALIDSHKLFLDGLKKILESISFIEVIALGKCKHDALKVINTFKPNLLVIDVQLVELKNLNQFNTPDTKIILLSGNDYDVDYMIEALILGARGFLLRSMQSELLIDAMLSIVEGKYWLHPNVSDGLAKEFTKLRRKYQLKDLDSDIQRPLHILTIRECEILELLVEGDSNLKIAEKLGITEYTVKTHVRNILGKMHVNDRTNAVLLAIRNGWVKIERVNNGVRNERIEYLEP